MVITPYREVHVPQRRLSARISKHLHELFAVVVEPAVPPENNQRNATDGISSRAAMLPKRLPAAGRVAQ